ncbi:uncharacterized protein Z518_08812 [Rhinocladiella mackenziei CBS 650.93]|uniref:Rhinocladiella mackenziei CBS 650.93 unplaced genomic scaffold supercont1.6, whole genome shotgun sequence n=1 Tax=Rhinocladiella mackenziei CBS 650.93 TaxID=1442369 RepID=A0A0D2IAJ3_9EURO|nr:uncharacterized protein Z518_08812 [Rhinocladiella mackenziei CBS 650.93]KIX02869.1 hypothetical protein Z518_08812 [Rhinocladiella mackenziei CBS 650.93]
MTGNIPALLIEPRPEELHPDVDRTLAVNLTRLLTLGEANWFVSRGKGPREREICLWCRGPLHEKCEIITHMDGKCNNSWALSCFMEWINDQLDDVEAYKLSCPMCGVQFYHSRRDEGLRLGPTLRSEMPAAWFRVTLFCPEAIHQKAENGFPIIFMSSEQVATLPLWGRHKKLFEQINDIPVQIRQTGPYYSIDHCKYMASGKPSPSKSKRAFDTWVLINFGHNEFRMSPFLPDVANQILQDLLLAKGQRDCHSDVWTAVTAEPLMHAARQEGGLKAALEAFKPFDNTMEQMGLDAAAKIRGIIQRIERGQDTTSSASASALLPPSIHPFLLYGIYWKLLAVLGLPISESEDLESSHSEESEEAEGLNDEE